MSEWIKWNGEGVSPVDEETLIEWWSARKRMRLENRYAGEHNWSALGYYRISESSDPDDADYLENFRAAMREELSNWRDPKQVDGKHYTDLVIQPLDVAYLNGMNSARTKVLKYVMREKNGLKDLKKCRDMINKVALYEYGVNLDEVDEKV